MASHVSVYRERAHAPMAVRAKSIVPLRRTASSDVKCRGNGSALINMVDSNAVELSTVSFRDDETIDFTWNAFR